MSAERDIYKTVYTLTSICGHFDRKKEITPIFKHLKCYNISLSMSFKSCNRGLVVSTTSER